MKSTVEPMNRYLIPSHHVHKKRSNSVELIVFLRVGLVFLFQCSKLHSELSWPLKWTEILGEKVHCTTS